MTARLRQVRGHVAPPSISYGGEHLPMLHITMGDHIAENAARFGDARAVISHWQGNTLTYRQLHEHSDSFAKGLATLGVVKGERIAICAGNCYEYIILFYAVAKLGGILVALNPSYTETELEIALKVVNVKFLFISSSLAGRSFGPHIKHIRRTLPSVELVVLSQRDDFSSSEDMSFHRIEVIGHESNFDLTSIDTNPHDIVNIQFTSGYTKSSIFLIILTMQGRPDPLKLPVLLITTSSTMPILLVTGWH